MKDRKGNELQHDSQVIVRARVFGLTESGDWDDDHVHLVTDGVRGISFWCLANQVELAAPLDGLLAALKGLLGIINDPHRGFHGMRLVSIVSGGKEHAAIDAAHAAIKEAEGQKR